MELLLKEYGLEQRQHDAVGETHLLGEEPTGSLPAGRALRNLFVALVRAGVQFASKEVRGTA